MEVVTQRCRQGSAFRQGVFWGLCLAVREYAKALGGGAVDLTP